MNRDSSQIIECGIGRAFRDRDFPRLLFLSVSGRKTKAVSKHGSPNGVLDRLDLHLHVCPTLLFRWHETARRTSCGDVSRRVQQRTDRGLHG